MATPPVSPTASINATANLNLSDLLRVLLTELTNQDPLKPVDNTEFLAQIAQFATLNSTQQTTDGIQQLVGLQAVTQTAGLLGKTVAATTSSGTIVNGLVTALNLVSGVPKLTITDGAGNVTPGITI